MPTEVVCDPLPLTPPIQDADFEPIFRECAPELLRRLRRGFGYRVASGERRFLRLTSAFDQQEVVQETFARFVAQYTRGTFDASRDPAPYIYRIGYNTALRYAGKLSREIPDEDVTVESDSGAPALEDVSEKLMREERVAQVRSVVTTLKEEDHKVYRLSYEQGLSQSQVAAKMELSRDQVYRVLVSIRSKVADHVKSLGWLDDA